MIRIAVCEDKQVLLEQLTGDVKTLLDKHSIVYNIESYTNGSALLVRSYYSQLI